MPIDPSILLQAQSVRLPDPLAIAQRQMTLADLANRQQLQKFSLDQKQRDDAAAQALQQALPAVLQAGFSDEAIQSAPPEAQQALLALRDKHLKSRADNAKTDAETRRTTIDGQQKAMRDIANVASQEAQNPNNLSLSRVRQVAQFYGVDLPQPPTDPRDAGGVQGYLQTLANAGYDIKDRNANAETARGHDLTASTTQRGQDMTAATAAAGQAVQRRGQDMVSARAGEANRVASAGAAGVPQEINVDGKPVLAIYDRRTGTFYDANTKQPIQGGIAPKQGDMPASLIEKMAQNEVTLTNIRNAREMVGQSPNSFGMTNYMGDTLMQRYDNEGVDARAAVSNIAGQKIHDRSGAAVTVGEMARLKPYIPNVTDTPETIDKKLAQFEREYSQIQAELAQGRSLAQVIGARSQARAEPAGGSKTFDSMPDPASLSGRRVRSDDGTVYRSDGKRWVRE